MADDPQVAQGDLPPNLLPEQQENPAISAPKQTSGPKDDEASQAEINDFIKEEKYGTLEQQAKAAAEGLASGLSFGTSTKAETALGIAKPEDILARQEIGPGHAIGEIGSLFVPGSLIGKAGRAAVKLSGLGAKGAGLLSIAGAHAVDQATQMAILQGTTEVSKMLADDPNQSIGTAAANVGLSGLIGGAGGAVLGSIAPLWKASVGNRVGQIAEDFKSRMKFNLENPNPVNSVTDELTNHYNKITQMADDVYGPQGLKAQDIAASMPREISSEMMTQANGLLKDGQKSLEKMIKNPTSYPGRLASNLTSDLNTFSEALTSPEATPGSIFNATQDLKQTLQGYSKYDKFVTPVHEAYDFVRDSKSLAFKLRNALEDSDVWGKAAERQKAINKAFTNFKPALQDFERRFTTKVGGEPQIDPGKINTYMNQLGKPSAEIKQEMLKNFLDASDKYEDVIHKSHANLGLESPMQATPMAVTRASLGEITPGASLADYLFKKGLSDVGGKAVGAGIGASLGHTVGQAGIGALVGEHALGPFFSHVLPALAKPLMETASHSEGLKAATDYGMAVAKGEAALNNAAKNVFHPEHEVLSESQMPTEKDRTKLNKTLKAVKLNEAAMLNVGGHLGNYLPRQASALAQTTINAATYLNSMRPDTAPKMPLDSKIKPSSMETAIYNNALNIAAKPLIILDKLKKGMLTTADIQSLNTLYPGLHERLIQKLTNEMTVHISKGESIPYKTRIGLSMFMAQPLDSTMIPTSIVAAQPMAPQTPPQAQGSSPSKVKTSGLAKLPKSYQTASQAAEKDRSDRS